MIDFLTDVIGLTFYMAFSPVVIILALFVGASGCSLLGALLRGAGVGLVSGAVTFPLLNLFASFEGQPSGLLLLFKAAIAGAFAGAAISGAMQSFSRRTKPTSRIEPQ